MLILAFSYLWKEKFGDFPKYNERNVLLPIPYTPFIQMEIRDLSQLYQNNKRVNVLALQSLYNIIINTSSQQVAQLLVIIVYEVTTNIAFLRFSRVSSLFLSFFKELVRKINRVNKHQAILRLTHVVELKTNSGYQLLKHFSDKMMLYCRQGKENLNLINFVVNSNGIVHPYHFVWF